MLQGHAFQSLGGAGGQILYPCRTVCINILSALGWGYVNVENLEKKFNKIKGQRYLFKTCNEYTK